MANSMLSVHDDDIYAYLSGKEKEKKHLKLSWKRREI
jgi:hypothetical protein